MNEGTNVVFSTVIQTEKFCMGLLGGKPVILLLFFTTNHMQWPGFKSWLSQ